MLDERARRRKPGTWLGVFREGGAGEPHEAEDVDHAPVVPRVLAAANESGERLDLLWTEAQGHGPMIAEQAAVARVSVRPDDLPWVAHAHLSCRSARSWIEHARRVRSQRRTRSSLV